MSISNEQQFAMDQLDESKKKPRISYTRKFLLSLSDKDVCKKLPNLPSEFIGSLFLNAEDPSPERVRISGDFSPHGLRRNDYSSSPPTRGEFGSNSRSGHGRWEGRSGGWIDKDSDSQSDRDSGSMSQCVEIGRGMPRYCSCGEEVVIRTSRTPQNPERLFQSCPSKMKNHLFKWIDESLVEEVQDLKEVVNDLKECIGKIENEMTNIKKEMIDMKKEVAHDVENEMTKCMSELHNVKNIVVCGVVMAMVLWWIIA